MPGPGRAVAVVERAARELKASGSPLGERAAGSLNVACRLLGGAVLLWAGLAKALDQQSSILAVDSYDVLPAGLVRLVAVALPWIEILVGLFLVTGLFVRFAGGATAVLALMFIGALGQAKARGLPIDCGCFGGGGPGGGVSWFDILRDVPILMAGLYLVWRPRGPGQLDAVLNWRDDDG